MTRPSHAVVVASLQAGSFDTFTQRVLRRFTLFYDAHHSYAFLAYAVAFAVPTNAATID